MQQCKEYSQKLLFFLVFLPYGSSFDKDFEIARDNPPRPPRAVLMSNEDGGLSFVSFAKNIPDLSAVEFDDKARSACVLGTWIFYRNKNYANFSDGVTALYSKSNGCFNFRNLTQSVSSIRFAGSAFDYSADQIDLFTGRFYTGIHLRANSDVRDVSSFGKIDPRSIIVSGTSAWTIYEQPSYSGASKCVSPKADQVPRFYRQRADYGGILVRSFRKGCAINV